jgi:hypothetical protein
MIEILPPIEKYKYDTWMILPVKCYIDNFVRLWSCIRSIILERGLLTESVGRSPLGELLGIS